MDNQKTALIFGVTGQDGSYLSEFLLNKGYRVIGVTRRCSVDNTERVHGLVSRSDFRVVEGDVSDFVSVSGIFNSLDNKVDEVYNLSAQSHVGTSFEQPLATWRINAEGPLNILEVVRRQTPSAKVYQASTSEMFGNNYKSIPLQSRTGTQYIHWQDESVPFAPTSPYAIAKLAAHHSIVLYRSAYNIFACSGILFNHESPRRGEKFVTRKISQYVARLFMQRGMPFCTDCFVPLKLGNLDARRDWGYAPDYVRAMWMMLQHDKPDDYVVGTGETHSVREFCQAAFACIGITEWEQFVVVDQGCMRPSDVQFLRGDAHKIRSTLKWEPSVTFKELVEIMVKADLDVLHSNQRH